MGATGILPTVELDHVASESVGRRLADAFAQLGCARISGTVVRSIGQRQLFDDASRLFAASAADKQRLATRRFNPASLNAYRGYFPSLTASGEFKEGFAIGPETADLPVPGVKRYWEPNVWPDCVPDPAGWRQRMLTAFDRLQALGLEIMRRVAPALRCHEEHFSAVLRPGNSTLRLMNYPQPSGHQSASGRRYTDDGRPLATTAHVDSACLTLLLQDAMGGLQVQSPAGRWIDVAPDAGALFVHVGGLLERWTGGLLRAVPHRVLDQAAMRMSIAFFVEPRPETEIRPWRTAAADPPEAAFLYADHLDSATTRFAEYTDGG